MKKLLAVIILAGLGYMGYVKWPEIKGMIPWGQTTPEPAPQTQAPPAVAPAGTYYLLQRISVTTDTGILGMPPGTKVTVVSTTAGGMRVTDGQNQFNVDASQVTNDLAVAARLPAFVQPTPAPTVDLAPAGTYFLLQRVSVSSDSGVIGISPGTKVTLISTTPTGMRVTDGQNQFDVATTQVTNDFGLARQTLKADKDAQALLDKYKEH